MTTFTLTITEDTEDALLPFVQARDWHSLAWDFDQLLRSKAKHAEDPATTWAEVRRQFHEAMRSRGLEFP